MGEELELFVAIVGTLILAVPVAVVMAWLKIGQLNRRLDGLEAAVLRLMRQSGDAPAAATSPAPAPESDPVTANPAGPPPEPAQPAAPVAPPPARPGLEQIIGERWLGWVGIAVLLFGAAFALKYAFDNRWIGDAGKVAIGVAVGLVGVWYGWNRHRAGWTTYSQISTAGGATLTYLSLYASYGFYDLVAPGAAFGLLTVAVIGAHLLAVYYRAPSIALTGQVGGFLTPALLSTGQDNYVVLFSYLALLDAGVVLVSLLRSWRWLGTLSFLLTHLYFWVWFEEYHVATKTPAAMLFLSVILALFLVADLVPAARGQRWGLEGWLRYLANPLAFYCGLYLLLEDPLGRWRGAVALALAGGYAALASWADGLEDRAPRAASVGVAIVLVTVAAPVSLDAHWIGLAWGATGAVAAWAGVRFESLQLVWASCVIFLMALLERLGTGLGAPDLEGFRFLLNAEFFTSVVVTACLGFAWRVLRPTRRGFAVAVGMAGVLLLWLALTADVSMHYEALKEPLTGQDYAENYERIRALDLAKQASLSVLWAVYAAVLVGFGLRLDSLPVRWAGLFLFGVTVLKAFFFDIGMLEGGYRVAALLSLGALLLGVAWFYQRIARRALEA